MQRRRFGALALIGASALLAGRAASGADIAALASPADLRSDASAPSGARLVVVLFSLPDCRFCEAIRREQLVPLANDQALSGRVRVREVSIIGTRAFVGFDGLGTSESAFARRSLVTSSPTVGFFGPSGEQVGEPIVGALLADFYGAYLDHAVRVGLSRIDAPHLE